MSTSSTDADPLTPMSKRMKAMEEEFPDDSDTEQQEDSDQPVPPALQPDSTAPAPNTSGNSDSQNPFTTLSSTAGLTHLAAIIKKRCVLSTQSQRDLDVFCQTLNSQEHNVMLYAGVLQVRDQFAKITQPDSGYEVPDTLQSVLKMYSWAYILSPVCGCYRNGKPAAVVFDAMKANQVPGLPDDKHPQHIQVVVTAIGGHLNQDRNTLKTKLKDSVGAKSAIANVAKLAEALCSKANSPKITLQLYIRLAFLREVYKHSADKDYWGAVDDQLFTFKAKYKSAEDLDRRFNLIYKSDKKTYGDPAVCGVTAVSLKDIPEWQENVNKFARTAVSSEPKNLKRKRNEGAADVSGGTADVSAA